MEIIEHQVNINENQWTSLKSIENQLWFYPRSGEHFRALCMFYVLGTVVSVTDLNMHFPVAPFKLETCGGREKEPRAGRHAPFSPPLSTGSVPVPLTCC